MKSFFTSTTQQLAAVLAHIRSTMRAKSPRSEEFEWRRKHVALPTVLSRIPGLL